MIYIFHMFYYEWMKSNECRENDEWKLSYFNNELNNSK